MLNFIRSDLEQLIAYTPHPGGTVSTPPDRLDTNESPWDLPAQLKEKLAWEYQNLIEANRYPDGSHGQLKSAIANYVNESASLERVVQATNISVGNGSDELIRSVLIATCLGVQGAILVAQPTFSMYGIIAKTLGIPVVTIERSETDFAINLSQAQAALEQNQAPPIRVVFVVHPNSPTANPLTAAEISWLQELPEEILVVIDEAYFEFSQTSVVAQLAQKSHWMILRTFSKAFRLASHRVGYAVAHPQLITALEKVRLPYNLPSFSQAAAQLALNNRHLLLSTIPEILQERARLIADLSKHSNFQVFPSSANFIYVRPHQGTPEALTQITQALKAQGTLIRHTGGGLRITVGTPEENTRTLNRFAQIVNG